MPHQERVNIAVFIDFDNIEIGVKNTLGEHFDVGVILEALKERGEVVTKIAYADWTRAGEYSRHLTQHAIRLVQRNLTPGGDKNGADINLALDALEMAFTHPHINAYVIVGGDSDFLSLVEKLKQYDKKVFVVGGRAFTSIILQRNCHEFIAYENLIRRPSVATKGSNRPAASSGSAPLTQAFPLVRRAIKILADREVSPQTGLLKSTLLQLDSTFSERSYGASSFLDFTEKLAQAGLVQLKHAGRSVMVELNPSFEETEGAAQGATVTVAPAMTTPAAAPAPVVENGDRPRPAAPVETGAPVTPPAADANRPPAEALPPLGDATEGVRVASELLKAATGARWPMYLRNVKQILRQGGFDERRYGFGGLIDLLRAVGRDGLVRLERDRRGGLRVLQGPAFQPRTAPQADVARSPEAEMAALDAAAAEIAHGQAASDAPEPVWADTPEWSESEEPPITVVDTTAELLGRAKHRKPRTRLTPQPTGDEAPTKAPAASSRGTKKTAARKPATTRRPKAKKTAGDA